MEKYTGLEIAVIGLAGRFPQADTIAQFWENLKNGRDCISTFSKEEALGEGEPDVVVNDPEYVRANAFLANKKYFDAAFFNYRPDEAELMDPQMRIFHECCWEALEDSGYAVSAIRDKVGVFAAGTPNAAWVLYAVKKNEEGLTDEFTAIHLRDVSFLASRIAYQFNLKGPAVYMHTACSSSLVSVHEACSSLLLGECSMALAGGVHIQHFSKKGYLYKEGLIRSKDGKCRPFDQLSGGTVGGEGAGVVVLKRLKDALRDRDNIYAVIKGSAINNDGSGKAGFTAPGVTGQAETIRKAQMMARVDAGNISYIEAHGTATALGDTIEIEALNKAFAGCPPATCAIGSVKSNIGHLDSAAGVAGLIKTVLAIKNRQIPPSLYFTSPNPEIDFRSGPFYVINKLKEWEGRLRAGVSSFGIGGTNVHIILEEAPAATRSAEGRDYHLMVVSAKTKQSLDNNTSQLLRYLQDNPNVQPADTAFTLQTGREAFRYRRALVYNNIKDAIATLSAGNIATHALLTTQEELQHIVFMFPGQGTQYPGMCAGLYRTEKIFRNAADECLRIAARYTDARLEDMLFRQTDSNPEAAHLINHTAYTQPALFITAYSLARLFMHWGISPDYMIGHSIGEYVAACLSGVFTLDDAIRLVIRRGELMGQAPRGAMLSIGAGEEQVKTLLNGRYQIDISVINSEDSLVVSGSDADIDRFAALVQERGFPAKKLHTSHAFHSRMMDGVLQEFEREVASVAISEPRIPYLSNVTGHFVNYDLISQPSYWSAHLRNTVQFLKGTETLLQKGNACFIEMGPGRTLCNYIGSHTLKNDDHRLISTVRQARQSVNDQQYLLEKLGSLWLYGLPVAWEKFYEDEQRNKLSLPSYSFERTAFTTDFDITKLLSSGLPGPQEEGPIHVSGWKRSLAPGKASATRTEEGACLVFAGTGSFGDRLGEQLTRSGHRVIMVRPGRHFARHGDHEFEVDIIQPESIDELFVSLDQSGTGIGTIIHCGMLHDTPCPVQYEAIDERLEGSYLTAGYLARAIARGGKQQSLHIVFAGNHLAAVTEADVVDPLKATVLAPARIMPSELSHVTCKVIDIPYPFRDTAEESGYLSKIANETFYRSGESLVAYRFHERWVPHFDRLTVNEQTASGIALRANGTYLVTGGFGGMGLAVAESIALNGAAHVLLVHRSEFPQRDTWENWLQVHGETGDTSKKIRQLLHIESKGCRVHLYRADLSEADQVEKLIGQIKECHPHIHGLVWAAGEVDHGGIMMNRQKDDFMRYVRSKIHGLLLFEKFLDFSKLDFLSLFSSIGNQFYQIKFGQVAYNAANEFLESYGHYAGKKWGIHAFVVNWCDWLDVGMTVKTIRNELQTGSLSEINARVHNGIYPHEGVQIFHACLRQPAHVYIIYKGDLAKAMQLHQSRYREMNRLLNTGPDRQGTPDLAGTDLRTGLLQVYARFFGKNDISVKDDFFELGGDSLKAMTLVGRLNQALGAHLTISDIYRNPVIEEIEKELLLRRGAVAQTAILPAPEKADYPLSSEQRSMYFLQAFAPESTAYNETECIWVEGPLDMQKVKDVFAQLIRRHECLRTAFIADNELPRQIIVNDFSFLPEYLQHPENGVEELMRSFVRPFDLAKAPLLRVGIAQQNANEHLIIIDSHHIIMDGLSKFILLEDFKALYNEETLPALPLHYKDYAEWQQHAERQEAIARQKNFWLSQFDGECPVLELPADLSPPVLPDYAGAVVSFTIAPRETAALKTLATAGGTTIYTVLLSLFNLLLHKLSNQEDIVVGTPVTGRTTPELEQVIGMFVNTVALRNYPRGDMSVSELLQQVKERTLACFQNQSYPFEELVDALQPERIAGRNPLFDVMLIYQNAPAGGREISGLRFRPEKNRHTASRSDLTLSVIETGGQLLCDLIYATALFKKSTAEQFVARFKKIVEAVIASPEIKIAAIDVLLPGEEHRLLAEYNNTAMPGGDEYSVTGLFMEQVRNYPHNMALVCGQNRLTYEQLNSRAAAIAGRISEKLPGGGQRVALLFNHSTEMVASILGVLKAGHSFVPLSPDGPWDRNRFILADSNVKLLLVQTGLYHEELLEALDKDNIILVPENVQWESYRPFAEKPVSANAAAYTIYTSGTTGRPKGVEVMHKSLVNYAQWSIAHYRLTPADAGLQLIPYYFDGSGATFYPALLSGGALVLIPAEHRLDAEYIAGIIYRERITHFASLPGFYNALLDGFKAGPHVSALRYVVLGGEKASPGCIRKSAAVLPGVIVENQYGPTETTITATHNLLSPGNTSVIGKPVRNTAIYILGKSRELLPPGVKGEIYIAGAGLAKGYVNNESLTRERFVDNPFVPGQRMYHTGDLGIWLPDGNIRIAGRVDEQVKIRGFRIEPGEVEAQLVTFSGIEQATVAVRERDKQKYLVAWYLSPTEIDARELHRFLSGSLPAYMVPAGFVWCRQFPYTANGKLNKQALPDPVMQADDCYIPPATGEERILEEVWSKVLGVKSIGVTQNFFSLGGDSIRSVQISSRLRGLGYELSVKDIFTCQTIRELSARLRIITAPSDQSVVTGEIPCTPVQLWFFNRPAGTKHHFNQSVVLQFSNGISIEMVRRIFTRLQEHHDALRMVFRGQGHTVVQYNCDVDLPVEVLEYDLRQERDAGAEMERLCNGLQGSINLQEGPLMKGGLFHISEGSRLLIVIHHLVVDGVSWRILLEDIDTLYGQLLRKEPLVLPLKTDSYGKWSQALGSWMQTEQYGRAKTYWTRYRGEGGAIRRDHPEGRNLSGESRQATFRLSAETTERLLRQAQGAFHTQINDLLLTGLLLSLTEEYGIDRVWVDLESHGRTERVGANISRTVGWFTGIYPVLLEKKGSGPGEVIRHVKETLRQVPHNGLDYLIMRYLDKGEGAVPAAHSQSAGRISFNYLGQFDTDTSGKAYTIIRQNGGKDFPGNEERDYDWDVSGILIEGRLEMSITYSPQQYYPETIHRILQAYKEKLEALTDFCCACTKVLLSPSDLTWPRLTMEQLDALQQQYDLEDVYPLSPMQEGMLFHSLLDQRSVNYFEQMTLYVNGVPDALAIEQSMNSLLHRYTLLRTAFVHEGFGRPLQVVLKKRQIPFTCIDLRPYPVDSHAARIKQFEEKDKAATFQMGSDVLMRLMLLQTADDRFVLIWSHHHILMDGWCMGIILKEFRELYAAHKAGQPVNLRPAAPYAGYIKWLEERNREASVAYWKKYLKDFYKPTAIPLKKQVPADAGYRRGFHELILSRAQTGSLQEIAAAYKVTVNTIIQACWGLLLGKYNNVQDVVFGSVVSGRPPEIEGVDAMVGLFINTIPVRVQYKEEHTIGDLLQQMQRQALESELHQYHPLSAIQSLSMPGNNLFDNILAFENFPLTDEVQHSGESHHQSGFDITEVRVFEKNHYNLTLFILPGNELRIHFVYDANRYEERTIEQIPLYLYNLLEQVISGHRLSIADIDLVTRAHRNAILQSVAACGGTAGAPEDLVPASWHQERLWFIDRFEAGFLYEAGPVYHNIPLMLQLKGPVNPRWLEESLHAVIERHSILRTCIVNINEKPFQQIASRLKWSLSTEDLRLSPEQINERVQDIISKPFALDQPLVRASLLHTGAEEYLVVVVFHHIIVDRYSVWQLREELLSGYRSLQQGLSPAEKNGTLQYREFSKWEQETLSQLDPLLFSFWLRQLGHELKPLEIPTDRPRAAIHVYKAASADVVIPHNCVLALNEYEEATGIPAGILLMAAFKILLHKYAQQEEIVIGTSVHNRNEPCLREVIGPVANLVVTRSFVNPESNFSSYARALNNIYNRCSDYNMMPFDKLVQRLAPEKDMSRTALFDVFFCYEDNIPALPEIEGLSVTPVETNLGYGKYDCNLFLQKTEQGINGKLVYNAGYFDHGTITMMVQHYGSLLAQLTAHPDRKLHTFELVSEQERNRLLISLDNTAAGYPQHLTVTDIFAEQVRRAPGNIAVQSGSEKITYAELDKRARRLAHTLRAGGVQRDDIVALLMDRSIDTIVSMLGILQAGGAYLPVDTDYPDERIQYLLHNSAAHTLVATRRHKKEIPFEGLTIFIEDITADVPEGVPLDPVNQPSDLCYVIYTSGTTGHPKGVMVEHRNVVRLFFNDRFPFQFSESDVWTMFHSHCFDFSVWEIFGALLFGGKVIVIPKWMSRDTPAFVKLLNEERVTVLNQTPGAFYNLIQEEISEETPALCLRYVIFGGEALAPGKLKAWKERYPGTKLINMYGITETTVHVTFKEIGEYEIAHNISNIGRPLPTLSVYILDQYQKMVPPGVTGELVVGGAGVTRGYRGKDELTKSRFIPDPFHAGAVAYRSGDLARVLPAGELEYIGRMDNQVQLRGFRVEPGEIEAQLTCHPNIQKAVVVAKEKEGGKYLVAYYVSDIPLELSELKAFLLLRLPDYMVPAWFVHLYNLPMTPNGKPDRKALPEPEITTGSNHVEAGNEIEKKLVGIWAEVLELPEEKIGIYSNFFELGGHSINLIKVHNRINETFHCHISVADMFRLPTIKSIEAFILGGGRESEVSTHAIDENIDEAAGNLKLIDNLINN